MSTVHTFRQTFRTETGYDTREMSVTGPLYHGGGRGYRGGDLRTGRRTNTWGDEGEYSRYIHFTTDLATAARYAELTGGNVFEVVPTGAFLMGYGHGEYKSTCPLAVVRKLGREEWSA